MFHLFGSEPATSRARPAGRQARRWAGVAILGPLAIVAALSLQPANVSAEELKLYTGELTYPGEKKMPIALPRPVGGSGAVDEFYDVLENDLRLSGWFEIMEPGSFLEPAGTGVRPGQFRYEDWDSLGTAILGKTLLQSRNGNQLYAEAWVYDVAGARRLGARSFSADGDHARLLAHKVANEIIYRVTLRDGPFNTRFAASATFSGTKEIYTVDFDGYGLTRITKNGSINIQPAWDHTGTKIAYTSYAAGNPDLYVADLSGGQITRVSARNGINSGADWHPSRNLLALTLSPGGNPDIYTIDGTTGRQMGRLTKDLGIDVGASWSPDGSQIAFSSDRSGKPQLYVANADGSDPRRVTFMGNYNVDPAWHPEGNKLTFVGRDGNFDVLTINVDGSELTRITQGQGDNEDPSFSPDGYYVAFSSTRTGQSHIFASTINGRHQVQLTRGKGGYTNPDWSPKLDW
jgi:TolB protein